MMSTEERRDMYIHGVAAFAAYFRAKLASLDEDELLSVQEVRMMMAATHREIVNGGDAPRANAPVPVDMGRYRIG